MAVLYYVTYGVSLHYVTFTYGVALHHVTFILILLYRNYYYYYYYYLALISLLIFVFYVLHVISQTEINQSINQKKSFFYAV